MAEHASNEIETPPLVLLGIDSLAFLIRNRVVFLLSTLPIAALAGIAAWFVSDHQTYAELANHWGWDFLFALIYVMFLDRWMKETLLDDASPCEEVDELRRSLVPLRLMVIAAACYLLALVLGMIRLEGIGERLMLLGLPEEPAHMLAALLCWLPHVFIWSLAVSPVVLLLPASSGIKPLTLGGALALGRPLRSKLSSLIFGFALTWCAITTACAGGATLLPGKPWAAAAMAAALRLGHCLVLALAGYVLATLWRQLTDWQPPEPADRPFRDMRLRPRKAM